MRLSQSARSGLRGQEDFDVSIEMESSVVTWLWNMMSMLNCLHEGHLHHQTKDGLVEEHRIAESKINPTKVSLFDDVPFCNLRKRLRLDEHVFAFQEPRIDLARTRRIRGREREIGSNTGNGFEKKPQG